MNSETGKVDYEAVMELLKLAIREPILKKDIPRVHIKISSQ